jgi:2-oxoglutarate dehydrogenase complex dehydrogenase (E1) component-like enzyme
MTLRNIMSRLKETYCSTIGYEYMHIPNTEKCDWIREKIEVGGRVGAAAAPAATAAAAATAEAAARL